MTGLGFVGALEIMGMGAARYGNMQARFYWIGAINTNLWWGLIAVVFGCVILGMSLASPPRCSQREG
ncbi:MAG: hypothetical protein WKF28_02330 [Rubrobacteraceae bacterium]